MKTLRFMRILVVLMLIVSLLPLLCISFYNHPGADDYDYSRLSRETWTDTHNFIYVLSAAVQQAKTTYYIWQGTFSAVVLFALQPGIYGEQFYFLGSFILLSVLIFSTFFFCRTLLGKIFDSVAAADIVAGTALIVSIQLIPAPVEGFFWWNGSSYYMIFYSLMLIQVSLFLRMFFESGCLKGTWLLCAVLGLFLGGGNYITALLTVEVTVLFLIIAFVTKRNRGALAAVSIVSLLSFAVNVAAPGNAVRQAAQRSMPALKAIFSSFYYAYRSMNSYTDMILLLMLVFLFPFLWKACKNKLDSIKRFPLFPVLSLLFAAYASSFTPTLYAMSSAGPGRVQNIRFCLWVLLCILAEMACILWAQKILADAADGEKEYLASVERRFGKKLNRFVAAVMVCACCFLANHILEGRSLTSVAALSSIMSGEAREYDQAMDRREEILHSDVAVVELEELPVKPYVLFFYDIGYNAGKWPNTAVAEYYHKETVSLVQGEEQE